MDKGNHYHNHSHFEQDLHNLGIINEEVVKIRLDTTLPLIQVETGQENALQVLKRFKVIKNPIQITDGDMMAVIVNRYKIYDLTDLGIKMNTNVFEQMLSRLKQLDYPKPERIIVSGKQLTDH